MAKEFAMTSAALEGVISRAACRVLGWQEASNDSQRTVIAALSVELGDPSATVLCEPSLARKSTRPPDVVLVDLIAGLHVIEVKGITLDQVEALEAGGQFRIRYENALQARNPFAQVRNAMFDIKDAVERNSSGEVILPFKYWVLLTEISRSEWFGRWGADAFCPPELLFQDDLPSLVDRFYAVGHKQLQNAGIPSWPADQLQLVFRAFGDSSVLFPTPEDRSPRRVREGTLGEAFDEAAESYKTLSDEQQTLSAQNWERGPRLIRGVAGSGKTVVLANNLARRLQRELVSPKNLFGEENARRVAAICFNRSLAPYVRKKIEVAYRQRTGQVPPPDAVKVWSYNRLLWHLSRQGLWRYQPVETRDEVTRAAQYLRELENVKQHDPMAFERCAFDALYIDEGQDFLEEDFKLLKALCRPDRNGEPSLFIFYDDAQNLYGRPRPNWQSLGLTIVGRSHVMSECFRNAHPIVESAFNVLYGSFAPEKSSVPTKAFGDITTLEEKGLLSSEGGVWRVKFAKRNGLKPKISLCQGRQKQAETIVQRLRWLIGEQQVRPEDINVLVYYRNQVENLVRALRAAQLPGVEGIHDPTLVKDELLHRRGWLCVSTVASAKGYDSYCVLLAGADEFPTDVQGRASFYVACTRAIEYLEVFASAKSGLASEMEQAVASLR